MLNLSNVDKNLLLFVNKFTGSTPVIDDLVRLVVNEYFIPVSLALFIVFIWFSKKSQRKVLTIGALSVGLVNLVIAISNQVIVRPRPFDELSLNLLFYKPTDPSFPSNAAAVAFTLAISIFIVNRKLGVVAILMSVIYSFSRFYAGVHYPTDILAGIILGILAPIVVSRFGKLINFVTSLIQETQSKLRLDL